MKSIDFLAFILPFTNEFANVLTSSGYKSFEHLYRPCIDRFLIDEQELKYIKEHKICKNKNVIYKLLIDFIALIGIILNISRSTLENGYTAGVLSGINIVMLSFIIPNLYLHKLISYFNFKTKLMKLLIGIGIIGILLSLTLLIDIIIEQVIIQYLFYKVN
jgi:hypothetical protein